MILYHCATMYQVLEAIIHRERVHAEERCILLLADFSAKKYHDYRELEAFFDEVLLFPYRLVSNDPETILEETEQAYRDSVPYGITKFEHIYVAAAYYSFSLYLISNGVSFHMFEDGGGMLSKPKILYDIIRDVTPVIADIAQTYGLLDGRNEYIRDAICNFSAQSFISGDPKWKDFDPASEIAHLNPETICAVMRFYRLEPIRGIPEDAVLVFTQQFSNLYTTTLEDQIAIYQVCADFFLRDRSLIFKSHPDDTVDYARFFPEARTIRGRFPAELMTVLLDRIPDTSFTVSSSSVRNLRGIFRKNIVCGYDFPNTFRACDRYYFAVKLLSELEETDLRPVHTFGVDVTLLEALAEYSLKVTLPFVHETALKKETADRQVWLIDDRAFKSDYFQTKEKALSFAYRRVEVKGVKTPEPDTARETADLPGAGLPEQPEKQADALTVSGFLDALGEEDIVIFLDSRSDLCFDGENREEQLARLVPIRIRKRRLRDENVFFPDGDLIFYVYTGDAGIREKAMRFHAGIVLENTGLAEEILPLDQEHRESVIAEVLREVKKVDQPAAPGAACSQPAGHPGSEGCAPETRISMEEYLDRAMDLNDMSMKAFLMDKINMFLRPGLRELMRRPALVPAASSDDEIRQFLQTWGKVVGKRNSSAGEGFRIYTDNGTDPAGQIRSDGADILEPYIRQHGAYQAIYPDSLNTVRIHTVRSGSGVRIFLPVVLSVGGGGAVTDISASSVRYRVLLSEDGSIIQAYQQEPGGPWQAADRHRDTGYLFRRGRKLPGISACVECCRKEALFIPEMRYIGWDVAVTDKGPVIVEANNISAFIYSLQQIKECAAGTGIRAETEELLAFGMEGVRYDTETVFVSEPFVGVGSSLPDVKRLYLILLQSALHRHGVEFFDRKFITPRPVVKKHCSIRYLEEGNLILLQTERSTERFPQPDAEKLGLLPYSEDGERLCVSEEDFFALDQLASQEAARIWRALAPDAGSCCGMKKDSPRLSVILPTYNCEAFLTQTLENVLLQLTEDCELIVVDDGSSDASAEILKRYEGRKENLRIAYRDHAGVSGARNYGLDLARGKYITFLDCDDCLEQDFLQKSLPLLEKQAGLYILGIERIHLEGNSEFWTVPDRTYDNVSEFADDYIRSRNLLVYSNCNKFYCRSIIEQARLRFEEGIDFGEDRLFNYGYLRLLEGQDLHPAVITSSLVMLRYIQRDRLSQSTKSFPHFFRRVMRLHEEKIRCFFALSKGTSQEERMDFSAYDLLRETEKTIDRFAEYPGEQDENLPEINRMVFGGPYDSSAPVDVLVILGSRNCAYKADAAVEIGKRNPGMKYIVSGANLIWDQSCSEAEFLYDRLKEHGVAASDIYLENRARYTRQNLEFAAQILRKFQADGTLSDRKRGSLRVGFLTGGFHIPRARLILEEIMAGDNWEVVWFPAYGPNTRPESWFENPTGRDVILTELRKTALLRQTCAASKAVSHAMDCYL